MSLLYHMMIWKPFCKLSGTCFSVPILHTGLCSSRAQFPWCPVVSLRQLENLIVIFFFIQIIFWTVDTLDFCSEHLAPFSFPQSIDTVWSVLPKILSTGLLFRCWNIEKCYPRINHYPVDKGKQLLLSLIHWIDVYLVDNAIQHLNNSCSNVG